MSAERIDDEALKPGEPSDWRSVFLIVAVVVTILAIIACAS